MKNADGDLLYIGVSIAVISRVAQHASGKDWFYQVSSVGIEHFDCIGDAEAAEIAAIKAEKPKYNVTHLQEKIIRERKSKSKNKGRTPMETAIHKLHILQEGMRQGDGDAGMYAERHMDLRENETYADLIARARFEIDGGNWGEL